MAIIPLSQQAIPEIKPLKQSGQSVSPNQSDLTPGSDSDSKEDLEKQIEETKTKSVRYQIIEKMLIKPNEDSKETKTDALNSQTPPTVPTNDDSVNISSASLATLSAEQQQTVRSENGVSLQQQNSESSSLSFSQQAEPEVQKTDPLAFDLDGNGLETTGINNGIEFDIDGDGNKEQTSFISGNDAFLTYDKNGNGIIDSGKELFGDQNGASNGYEELKKYDDNQDGIIDKQDAIYNKLQLLKVDENNQQQLSGLKENGVQSINLNYANTKEQLNLYDSVEQTATYTKEDGTTGKTGDILLGHKK